MSDTIRGIAMLIVLGATVFLMVLQSSSVAMARENRTLRKKLEKLAEESAAACWPNDNIEGEALREQAVRVMEYLEKNWDVKTEWTGEIRSVFVQYHRAFIWHEGIIKARDEDYQLMLKFIEGIYYGQDTPPDMVAEAKEVLDKLGIDNGENDFR